MAQVTHPPEEALARAESEAGFERWFRSALHLRQWEGYHTRDSQGSTESFPDWVCWRERIIFVELKRQTGRLTIDRMGRGRWGLHPVKGQARVLLEQYLAGGEIYVVRPLDRDWITAMLDHRGREGWRARSQRAVHECVRRSMAVTTPLFDPITLPDQP